METIREFVEIVVLLLEIILPFVKIAVGLVVFYSLISVIVIYFRCKITKQDVTESVTWWTGLVKIWIDKSIGKKNANDLSVAEQLYYPILLEVLYEILSDKYEVFDIYKPKLDSDLITTDSKVTDSPNGVVYEYTALLENSEHCLEEDFMKQILQKELVKRSYAGFKGITFENGYPVIQVHEIKILDAYLHIRLIVLWNEADMKKYKEYCDRLRITASCTVSLDDEVF